MPFSIPFLDQLTIPLLVGFLWGVSMWGWPVASIMLMPLFFPFYLVKFSIHGVPFTLVEWFIYVSFFIHFFRQFHLWRKHRDRGKFSSQSFLSLWAPIILLILTLAVSLFIVPTAIDRQEVLGIFKGWFLAPIMYFYLVIHVLPGLKSIRRCLEWYTISAVMLSVFGIAQRIFHITGTPDGRVPGPFSSANYLALYIMPAMIFVVIRLWHVLFVPKEYTGFVQLFMKVFHAEEKISYLAVARYALAGALILTALYLTRSFGAFLGLFVALVTYACYHWFFSPWRMSRRQAFWRFSLFGLGVAFVVGTFFVTGDFLKFRQLFNVSGQSSSAVRLQVWTVAERFIEEHPFFGIGPGRFQELYAERATQILGKVPYDMPMLHPHNLFLMFWLSTGVLGLIAFLWLIFLLFRIVYHIPGHDGRKRLGVICAAMLLGILIHGLVDTPIWKNDLALQFWMIAGIIGRLAYAV